MSDPTGSSEGRGPVLHLAGAVSLTLVSAAMADSVETVCRIPADPGPADGELAEAEEVIGPYIEVPVGDSPEPVLGLTAVSNPL